jgi:hypothetical protein
VAEEPGDSNCSFLSAAAPSLPFLAFSPLSLVFPSFSCSLFSLASSSGFCHLASLVLLPSGGSAVVGSADGGGMAVVPEGEARFFFFSLQRRRLLPFLQWCCNVWGEDGELRKNDNGVGSVGVFVYFRASPSSSLLFLFRFLSSYSLRSPLIQKFPPCSPFFLSPVTPSKLKINCTSRPPSKKNSLHCFGFSLLYILTVPLLVSNFSVFFPSFLSVLSSLVQTSLPPPFYAGVQQYL